MRTRAKAITVATAMVATFGLLPALGASAAEPLADGTYEIPIEETTYTLEVVDGVPAVPDPTVVEFNFEFDDDSQVLDEFEVIVGSATYLVEIADDGAIEVTPLDDDTTEGDDVTEDEDETADGEETADEDTTEDDELDDTVLVDEDDEEAEATAAESSLVATVAKCAPRGWEAAEAGLPNHGFFVSNTARGEQVDFAVDGETYTADLTTSEGVATFCALADDLIEAADLEPRGNQPGADDSQDDEGADESDDIDEEGTDESDDLDDEPAEDTDDETAEDDDTAEGDATEDDSEDDGDTADEATTEDDDTDEGDATDDDSEADDSDDEATEDSPADRGDRGASQRDA